MSQGQAVLWSAALCAALAARLLNGPDTGLCRSRLVLVGAHASTDRPRPLQRILSRLLTGWRAQIGPEWSSALVGVALAVLGESVAPLVAGLLGVPLIRRLLRLRASERAKRMRAVRVAALCGAIAAELRAGLQPVQALLAAVRELGPGAQGLGVAESTVVAAATFGGDVPQALREAASAPGAAGLAGLAACWQVSVDGGAGLADGLDRLERSLRAECSQQESLRAQVAGARSTAVVLAVLPAAGLAIGTVMGADPLRVLLHTTAGAGCLLTGVLLETVGLYWVRRIIRPRGRS
ncbi:type II secretion system F family protein [Streptomyces sp. NPDC006879]|uniref:type II secretion system F family protein n=1 Tax=Streptomyces sp. NPDC006879 TaxID=3364767 RepID=UPI0036C5DC17